MTAVSDIVYLQVCQLYNAHQCQENDVHNLFAHKTLCKYERLNKIVQWFKEMGCLQKNTSVFHTVMYVLRNYMRKALKPIPHYTLSEQKKKQKSSQIYK